LRVLASACFGVILRGAGLPVVADEGAGRLAAAFAAEAFFGADFAATGDRRAGFGATLCAMAALAGVAAVVLPAATLLAVVCFVVVFAVVFPAARLPVATAVGLGVTFFATGFFATAFFTAAFLATDFLATDFFATDLFAAVRPADAGMRALAMLPPPSCGHCRDGVAITRPAFTPGERPQEASRRIP
jgi:hypothetical protein